MMYIISIAIVTIALGVIIYSQISENFTSHKSQKKSGS